jgi:pantoate--beta-alanine ligase
MGMLHNGHISLIESSKKKCKKTIVSIFINPSQFNKKNDYKKYPRKLSNDIEILKRLKIDFLFLPRKNQIYKNKKIMKLKLSTKDKILCAKFRKGHFEGVLAVINQYLNIIKPRYMFLGNKDFQQLYLIKKFVKKKFKTKIVSCKTIRDKKMVALSSRNNLLSNKDLYSSSKIAKLLFKFKKILSKNFNKKKQIKKIKDEINKLKNIDLEYLEIRNKFNLSNKINKHNFKIFVAYYNKNVRLIDNY